MIRPQHLVQILTILPFVIMVLFPPGPHTGGWLPHPYFPFDPYLALLTLVGGGCLAPLTAAASGLLLVLTMARGAFFCRSLCPLGACQDLLPSRRSRRGAGEAPPSGDLETAYPPGAGRSASTRRSGTVRWRSWVFVTLVTGAALGILPSSKRKKVF
jgi:hypothetical protein